MSVLLITIMMYGPPSQVHFAPVVHSVDFNTTNACQTARDAYLRELGPITTALATAIKQAKDVGNLQDPAGIFVTAQCFER
ncbi:hypothetical protein [Microvirga calopogonii]|uniref:hypothetical protein n=1 Tax=Microvirga calopogonii TaxID=2078013 RepID=UPI000E0D955D|nr:hypothetical protein [Microvirga calopogonii]